MRLVRLVAGLSKRLALVCLLAGGVVWCATASPFGLLPSDSPVADESDSKAVRLGGIGTGWIEWLGEDGFGRIAVTHNRTHPVPPQPGTFAAVWTEADGRSLARVLMRRPAYDLPHAAQLEATGASPFASLRCADPGLPVSVSMRAFSPLVPHDIWTSATPAVLMMFTVRNVSRAPVGVAVALSWQATLGMGGAPGLASFSDRTTVRATRLAALQGMAGVRFDGPDLADKPVSDLRAHNARGSQAMLAVYPTPDAEVTTASWNAAGRSPEWWPGFAGSGRVEGETGVGAEGRLHPAGVVAVKLNLRAGEVREISFAVAWHHPRCYIQVPAMPAPGQGKAENVARSDSGDALTATAPFLDVPPPYTARYADAVAVARVALEDRAALAVLSAEWQSLLELSVAGRAEVGPLARELNEAVATAAWRAAGYEEKGQAWPVLLADDTEAPTEADKRILLQPALLALFPALDAADIERRLVAAGNGDDCAAVGHCARLILEHSRAVSGRGWLARVWPQLRDAGMPILRKCEDGATRRAALETMLDLAAMANDTDTARECATLRGESAAQQEPPQEGDLRSESVWARWQRILGCAYDAEQAELRLAPAVASTAVRLAGPAFMPNRWAWCDWRQLPVRTTVEFTVIRVMHALAAWGRRDPSAIASGPPLEVRRIVMRPPRGIADGEVRTTVGTAPVANSAHFMSDGSVEILFDAAIRLEPGDRLRVEVVAGG